MALPVEVLEGKPINPAAEAGFANPLEWLCRMISLPFIKGINMIYVRTAFRGVEKDIVTLRLPRYEFELRAVKGTFLAQHISDIVNGNPEKYAGLEKHGKETVIQERIMALAFPPWDWVDRPDLSERPKP